MQITYTQHALTRMAERGISRQEVQATLAAPGCCVPAAHGRVEFQGFIERAGKRQLLRVLTEGAIDNEVVLVITVMATSKLEKYGVKP